MAIEYPWINRELTFRGTCKRGDRLPEVRMVQEWLNLNGYGLAVDSDFGPATERAVKAYQKKKAISPSGVADQETFAALVSPMQRALAEISSLASLGKAMIAYAKQHLAEQPREVGGQNRGPWVRLYMEGHEGKNWPWCAGFVCFILRQATDSLQIPLPFKPTFSCDELAARARTAGLFLSGLHLTNPKRQLLPGSIFLNRKDPSDWTHTGLVTAIHDETFETIEGNTNDVGDREGYEVCQRMRSYDNKDFVLIA